MKARRLLGLAGSSRLFLWFAALLAPVLVSGAVALWLAHGHLPSIVVMNDRGAEAETDPSQAGLRQMPDGSQVIFDRDGNAWPVPPDANPAGGRSLAVASPSGLVALAWEEADGSHIVYLFDRDEGTPADGRRIELPVFTTQLLMMNSGHVLAAGLDGQVRLIDMAGPIPTLVTAPAGAPSLEGRIRFMFATADPGGFAAIGADGRRMLGRVTDSGDLEIDGLDADLAGQYPALVRYSRIDSVVPRKLDASLQRFRECDLCPELIAIPQGSFRMGSPPDEAGRRDDEGPVRDVSIGAFALARTEVTVAEFEAFVDATGHQGQGCLTLNDRGSFDTIPSADWQAPGFAQDATHPAVCVNWEEAKEYIAWLNEKVPGEPYRLPTEAEWEYAARAGSVTRFHWGDDPANTEQCTHANGGDAAMKESFPNYVVADCADGYVFTAPVGQFASNRFGLTDMSGNAWEWVEDCWHESYENAPGDGRAWMETDGGDCSRAVLRGGAWGFGPGVLRSALRGRYRRDNRSSFVGFRLARTLPD